MRQILKVFLFVVNLTVCSSSYIYRRISPYNPNLSQELPDSVHYETLFFDQQVDHFGFYNKDTFKHRYLVADQFWNHNGGPIFFYTGNEGDITWFCNNTGFMWDIANEFKALLVFAEHRYYGSSIPYGPSVFKDSKKLNYLTSEQALADFAVLVKYLKDTMPGATNSSVIAFGGSYGGMLAAWFRIKYSGIVDGALAASAPIWQFQGLTPCSAFLNVTTNTFSSTSRTCANNIRRSWKTIDEITVTAEGRRHVSKTFRLCKDLTSTADVTIFKDWLSNIWVNLAMVDYPYPANFLEPLPAWPIKVACSYLLDDLTELSLIDGLYKAVNVYFNSTGNVKCLNTSQQATGSLGDAGWDYQACTEMVMPACADTNSMFEPSEWNFTAYSEGCYKQFKVKPREYWIIEQYNGKNIKDTGNIIFSNGLYDPWSSGGVMQSLTNTMISIQIPYGAHHLDLRFANAHDTSSVRAARTQEKNIIRLWLTGNSLPQN
ncbi:lysosomal Pro-X carboxypeptidase-like [Gigantopelta aegis]|uniref:lysosomal Pro-X carboxypeptidase-like n=1 Tax=Gigantopelta aegis TaxID=1735272 RepID=UPI001B8875E8|nr:lysosomal Pro-X carboxypeptidase-like [Gigantopelta aegis]